MIELNIVETLAFEKKVASISFIKKGDCALSFPALPLSCTRTSIRIPESDSAQTRFDEAKSELILLTDLASEVARCLFLICDAILRYMEKGVEPVSLTVSFPSPDGPFAQEVSSDVDIFVKRPFDYFHDRRVLKQPIEFFDILLKQRSGASEEFFIAIDTLEGCLIHAGFRHLLQQCQHQSSSGAFAEITRVLLEHSAGVKPVQFFIVPNNFEKRSDSKTVGSNKHFVTMLSVLLQ